MVRDGQAGSIDPGTGEAIVAIDDALFSVHAPAWAVRLARSAGEAASWARGLLRRAAQWSAERQGRDARESSLRQDRRYAQWLAFSGRGE